MASYTWVGTTSDPAISTNWNPVGVPGTGDDVTFDGSGNNPCTLTAHWTLGGMVTVVGYTAKLDLATFNLTMDNATDIVLDQGGEFDCGTGTISLTNGDFDNKDCNTFTSGTSSITFNNTCVLTGNSANTFYDFNFAAGSAVTVHADTVNDIAFTGTCTFNGAVVINQIFKLGVNADLIINSTTNISGSSYIYLNLVSSGHGIITLQSGAVIGVDVVLARPVAGTCLAAGVYDNLVKVLAWDAMVAVMQLDLGVYTFDGGLELQEANTATVTLDNSANGPSINVTDLLYDIDGTGGITIDDSGQSVDWNITGDIINEKTGAGAFTWTNGTGTITFIGTADQDADTNGVALDNVVFGKSAGTVTTYGDITLGADSGTFTESSITSGLYTVVQGCDGIIGSTGTFDLNDYDLVLGPDGLDMSAASAATVDMGTGTLVCQGDFKTHLDTTWYERTSTAIFDGGTSGDRNIITVPYDGGGAGGGSCQLYKVIFAYGGYFDIQADLIVRNYFDCYSNMLYTSDIDVQSQESAFYSVAVISGAGNHIAGSQDIYIATPSNFSAEILLYGGSTITTGYGTIVGELNTSNLTAGTITVDSSVSLTDMSISFGAANALTIAFNDTDINGDVVESGSTGTVTTTGTMVLVSSSDQIVDVPSVGTTDILLTKEDGDVTVDAVGTLSGSAGNGVITIENIT